MWSLFSEPKAPVAAEPTTDPQPAEDAAPASPQAPAVEAVKASPAKAAAAPAETPEEAKVEKKEKSPKDLAKLAQQFSSRLFGAVGKKKKEPTKKPEPTQEEEAESAAPAEVSTLSPSARGAVAEQLSSAPLARARLQRRPADSCQHYAQGLAGGHQARPCDRSRRMILPSAFDASLFPSCPGFPLYSTRSSLR
ncbi:hypothetical protein PtB15_18B291 [Puccinia triticina]|nr:hypothetical protein PtB15_18B291 [Puccinia triticina]